MDITKKWTRRRRDWGEIHSQPDILRQLNQLLTIADFSDNVKADGIKFRPLKYLNFVYHFDFIQNLKKPNDFNPDNY